MNCRRFEHRLYEYLEGSLSRGAQAAVERHLSACAACRQTVDRERQIEQALAGSFRRATGSLRLPPEVQRRVLTALAEERSAAEERRGGDFSWLRLAWPQVLAASVLLLLAGLFFFVRSRGPQTSPVQQHLAGDGILASFSYVVPIYTFRQEGGYVIDAMTYQTNVVNETLPAELARLK